MIKDRCGVHPSGFESHANSIKASSDGDQLAINADRGQRTSQRLLILWYACTTGIASRLDIYKMVYVSRLSQPYDMV